MATSVDKRHAIPLEFLENKSFTSKETGTDFTIECDGNSRAEGGTKEGILLAQQLAAKFGHVNWNDLAGVRGRESNSALA